MDKLLYLQCFVAGLLGVLCYMFFVKIPAFRKRSAAANKHFSPADYFKDDWLSIASSVLTVAVVVFCLNEFASFNDYILKYVRFFFVTVGYMGSSFLHSILSKTEKAITKTIDRKTDIADNKN
jgi:hypothetical protein